MRKIREFGGQSELADLSKHYIQYRKYILAIINPVNTTGQQKDMALGHSPKLLFRRAYREI